LPFAANSMAQNTRPFKPILGYPSRTIAQLRLQIDQQLAMLEQIRTVLPRGLANHALHCVLNHQKLLVYTDSANWATQLRFFESAMLTALESDSSKPVATMLQVKIINITTTGNLKRKALIPSQTVAGEIRDQSLVTADPQLKQALAKLSTTLARLQTKPSNST
jgi:hypothetical protein